MLRLAVRSLPQVGAVERLLPALNLRSSVDYRFEKKTVLVQGAAYNPELIKSELKRGL